MRKYRRTILTKHVRIIEGNFVGKEWFDTICIDQDSAPFVFATLMGENESSDDESRHLESSDTPMPAQEHVGLLTYYPSQSSSHGDHCVDEAETNDNANGVENTPSQATMIEVSSSENEERRYPQKERRQTECFSAATALLASCPGDPSTGEEALQQPDASEWMKALDAELRSLNHHNTWTRAPMPKGVKAISTRFIFVKKRKSDETVIRYKARVLVRGFLQGL